MTEALFRPIEITEANDDFTFSSGAVGATALALTHKVYANYFAVLAAFETLVQTVDATADFYLTDSSGEYLTYLEFTNAATVIEFNDPLLGMLLGFRDDIAACSNATATDQPEYSFFPPHDSYEQDRWNLHEKTSFAGSQAVDGSIAGFAIGPKIYDRAFRWFAVPKEDVNEDAELGSFAWDAVTYYPNARRCWQEFARGCRAAQVTATTSGNISCKNLYYVPNLSNYLESAHTHSYTNFSTLEGIMYDLDRNASYPTSRSADNCTYCAMANAPDKNEVTLDIGRDYYNLGCVLTTATAPTWV